MAAPIASRSRWSVALTLPWVPTDMNTGVSIVARDGDRRELFVRRRPLGQARRHGVVALPPWLHIAIDKLGRLVEGDPVVHQIAHRRRDPVPALPARVRRIGMSTR